MEPKTQLKLVCTTFQCAIDITKGKPYNTQHGLQNVLRNNKGYKIISTRFVKCSLWSKRRDLGLFVIIVNSWCHSVINRPILIIYLTWCILFYTVHIIAFAYAWRMAFNHFHIPIPCSMGYLTHFYETLSDILCICVGITADMYLLYLLSYLLIWKNSNKKNSNFFCNIYF